MDKSFPVISIPFVERHKCWFCGEPYLRFIVLPEYSTALNYSHHEPCQFPSCQECLSIIKKSKCDSVFAYRKKVKQALAKKYARELQMGQRWTEEELQSSELEGAAFLGFKRSAWLMHTIAKERVNYAGWQIEINGLVIDEELNQTDFSFDGMNFVNVEAAIDYYAEAYYLQRQLLTEVVKLLPREKFAFAIRLCRLYPSYSEKEYPEIFNEIKKRIIEE